MKHEILKKTLLYRLLAFGIGTFITTLFLWHDPFLSFQITTISELGSIALYYIFEYFWRKRIEKIKLKKGTNLFKIGDVNEKISIAYNVIEVLDENKFIIEVV